MADSLSSWMLSAVAQAVAHDAKLAHDQQGSNETPFLKGGKAQIIRFLGFGANGQRLDVGQDEEEDSVAGKQIRVPTSQDSNEGAERASALWAIVGDRTSWVCVRFSKECVSWFDSVHTRPLISLRGSIFGLRWFRPAVSMHAARMHDTEAETRCNGPFATATSANEAGELLPRLYLDVQTIHLWGSINEAIFHETADLQLQLFPCNDDSQESGPKKPDTITILAHHWFATMTRRAQRRAARQARLLKDASTTSKPDGTFTTTFVIGTSDESSQQDSFPSIVSVPPASQKPSAIKRKLPFEDESKFKRAKESDETSSRSANDGWDSAHRKWADDSDQEAHVIDVGTTVTDRQVTSDESNFTLNFANHATSPRDLLALSSNEADEGQLEGWRISDRVEVHVQPVSIASNRGELAAIGSDSSKTASEESSQNSNRYDVKRTEIFGTLKARAESSSQGAADDAERSQAGASKMENGGREDQKGSTKMVNGSQGEGKDTTKMEGDVMSKADEAVEWNELVDLPDD